MGFIKPFEATEKVSGATTTPWRLLPERTPEDYMDELAVVLGPDPSGTPGVGRIELTYAPIEDVKADNLNPGTIDNILPVAWPSGDVSVITDDVIDPPPTAYRIVGISDDIVFSARGV